jgi:hypothetical protein
VTGVASLTPFTKTENAELVALNAADAGAFRTRDVVDTMARFAVSNVLPTTFPVALIWIDLSLVPLPGASAMVAIALTTLTDLGTPKT